jgi:hypothetical protein
MTTTSEPMKVFTLTRTHSRSDGTFSVLDEEGQPFAVAVEPPSNSVGRYLTPVGEYFCNRVNSPKFGNTFEITGVAGHDHILFHWGNLYTDSLACVIVGEKFGVIKGLTAVQESKSTPNEGFNEFLLRTKGLTQFKLVIK